MIYINKQKGLKKGASFAERGETSYKKKIHDVGTEGANGRGSDGHGMSARARGGFLGGGVFWGGVF